MLDPFYEWLKDWFDPVSFNYIMKFPDRFQVTLSEFYKIYQIIIKK